MALRFVKKGDVVKVLHICNSDKAVLNSGEHLQLIGDSAVKQFYKEACMKAEFERNGLAAWNPTHLTLWGVS